MRNNRHGNTQQIVSANMSTLVKLKPVIYKDLSKLRAICKSWNVESGNGMRQIMGMHGIRVGMQGIGVGCGECEECGEWSDNA